MADSLRETGLTIRWKAEEYLLGQIIEDMRENILMIKKKDLVSFFGLMAESMKENGRMENNTGRENTHQHREKLKRVNGPKEKGLHGYD